MLTGILPLVENVCCFKEGPSTFNPDCVVETSRLPIEENACIFKEGPSTMDPNCAIEELSSSLLLSEPCSVAYKDPCKSLLAPDILGTEVLVGACNSISIVDSSGLVDEGNDNVKFDDVPVVEFPDTSSSVPSVRSVLTAKSYQKTLTVNTAREGGKTVVEKPSLDSFLLRVARKRRSYLCKPARCSVWGSWGYITQVFENNHGYDVNQNGRTRSQKARSVRGGGKRNRKHSQSSRGKSCASSGPIRLKVKLGREVIQNCVADMVSNTSSSLRNYRGTSIEVLQSTEGSENNINEEVPGIKGCKRHNQDQEKVVMSSDATHLGWCIVNKALDIPTNDEKSTEVNADNHQTLSSRVISDNRYLDSGTSPDSEVINLIQEAQVNTKVQEDLYDVLSSSQACVTPGDVTDLDVSQISSKKGRNKNKLTHVADSSVEDRLPLPEIINNEIGLEMQGHGEKMRGFFYSSEPSISTTVANVSGNTSSSEGFSRGPLSSLRGTESGDPFKNFKIEGGAEDIYLKHGLGIQSVDSNTCDTLHLHRKTKGRKHFKTSKSMRERKPGSEASDSPSSQKTNACKQKGDTVKSVRRRKGKDKGPCGEITCEVETYPETGDRVSADPEKVETENQSIAKNIFDLDTVPKRVGEQNLLPRSAWVCCDACLKWRRIPATLADAINETNGRWTCHDNMDKGFADCSIPQEMSNAEINAELQISDASCGEDGSDTRLNSNNLESKHSAVHPRSSWMLIKSNLFLHRTRKRQSIDEIMVCHCKPPQDGKMGCGDGCLNRMLNIECVRGTCPCGDFCSNQQFQKRKYANLNRVRCGKKGYGLETKEDIREGRFLIEYVGEVLDMQAYEARQREYASMGHKHFYFMTLNGSEVIDACAKGNLGRFINHSCDPNCRTEKWMVNGEVCIGLFALRDIKKGEELTFDYNYVRVFGAAAKECVCGSSQCRGYLGGDPQNTEAIVKDDSDEEYPEPVMFYEDGEIDDNWKHLTSAASPFDTTEKMGDNSLENKDKIGKSAIVGGHMESIREPQFSGIQLKEEDETGLSATAVHPLDISAGSSLIKSASGAQLHNSFKVDNSMEGSVPVLREETCLQLDHKSSKPISEAQKWVVQGLETSLLSVVSKPLSDAINSKKKFKYEAEDRHESKARTRLKTSRFPSSVKKGKSCGSSLKIDKSGSIVNKSNVPPNKSRKIMENSLNNRFEAVEEKLNELLDADGGISKRKDATKGYLKLLLLTATSGDSGNGEAIQSNRDLSMILDALLKTRSRIVLVDIISKNGLQMLHNIMKRYRRNFNKIPILRKLLKVLEYLAVREILTLEHINGGPRCLGVESFRESILTLTEHDDKQVHQIARNFRDRWIPKPLRKSSGMDRSDGRVEFLRDSDCNRYIHGHDKAGNPEEAINSIKQSVIATYSDDTGALEGCSASSSSGFPTNGTRARKRKSRWDEPGDISLDLISTQQRVPETQPSLLQKSHAVPIIELGLDRQDKLKVENREDDMGQNINEDVPPGFSPDDMGQKIDEDVPPGFSVLSTASLVASDVHCKNVVPSEFPCQVVMGHPNRRFNNRLATSYGIPLPVAQQFGIPQAETLESWIVAPGMPFQPFPPLPPCLRGKRVSSQPCVPNQVTDKGGEQICRSDQSTTSTSSGARIPVDVQIHGAKNRDTFQRGNGTHSLGRRYFRQKKWNHPQVGPPWIQNRNGPGFMVSNSRNGMCSSIGVATNEVNGQSSSEYVNPGVQNSSHTFHQYPQQQTHH